MKNKTLQTNMMMRVVLATLMCLVGIGKVSAQDFTVGNLSYSVNNDGISVTVTGHVNGTSATGTLEIPETVSYEGMSYAVTAIGDWAFDCCESLSGNLTIPNSVTSIGEGAFSNCRGFSSLSIGNSVISIGNEAFHGCRGFTGDLVIPNCVTSIGESAFNGCEGFTGSLTLSASLTTIQDYTFSWCKFTGSLIIPPTVTTIGNWAFDSCTEFSGDLILPNALTSIGNRAFCGCGFSHLSIPDAVTSIGSDAFNSCWFVGELYISRYVEKIGERAFVGCLFTAINVDSQNTHYQSQNGVLFTHGMDTLLQYPSRKNETSYNIPNSVTRIGTYAFCDCFLKDVTIPNSVTSIGEGAFFGTRLLEENVIDNVNNVLYLDDWCIGIYDAGIPTSISIQEGTKGIADGAFGVGGAVYTGTLSIPNSVLYIGNSAFRGGIVTGGNFTGPLVIPNSVVSIGDSAFEGCDFTGPLVIPNSVVSIGDRAFYCCDEFSGEFFFGNSVASIGEWAFAYCTGVNGSLTIPNTTVSIGESPFIGCDGIEHIIVDMGNPKYDSRNDCNAIIETATNTLISGCKNTVIPNSVTTIGKRAFAECHGLTDSLIIPNSVVTIGEFAFAGCSGMTSSLTIPNSVVTIGDYAFFYCNFTGDLFIGNSVESIGEDAFGGCDFNTVVSLNTMPPFINEDYYYSPFYGYINLIVSCGSKETYEASSWAYICSTIEEDCSPHNVIIDEANMSGGNVSASVTSTELGEEVQLTITPDEGMMLASLTVSNANEPPQTIPVYPIGKTTSMWGFIMPPFDVVITATFTVGNAVYELNSIEVSVYPNPTNGQVKIEAEGLKQITISNMIGQIIYEGKACGNAFEYDFSKHGAGLYLIRIETADGVALKKVSVVR